MQSAVKIGLLVTGDSVPFWMSEAIAELRDSNCAEFPLIFKHSAANQPAIDKGTTQNGVCPVSSPPASGFNYLGFRLYEKFDARLKRHQPGYDSAIALNQLLPDAEVVEYQLDTNQHSPDDITTGEQGAMQAISKHSIDLLLDTGSAQPDPKLVAQATLGVWNFCNGNGRSFQQQPSGFWELTSGAAVTEIALHMTIAEQDNPHRISVSRHLPDILLLGRQRQNVMIQAASQLTSAIKRLHTQGADKFLDHVSTQDNIQAGDERPYPNNWQMLCQLTAHAARYSKLKIRKWLFFEQWCLLLHHDASCSNQPCLDLSKFQEIYPPDDRIWADPFVIPDENDAGKFHIFIEEMEFSAEQGHISVLTVDSQGVHNGTVPIIKQPFHMSYPFIFEYQNERYMIPETGDNRCIQLYRCVNFPLQWVFVKNLMDNTFAVDTTLQEVDGKWWMFTTVRESEHTDCLDQLQVFHADSPLSDQWQAHPHNPVSRDVRVARPAGALFKHDGKLLRPSQDGGYHYGWGMKINQVTRLDEEQYVEQEDQAIEPDWHWSVIATHTLNYKNGMTACDARILRFRLMRWIRSRIS